IYRQEWTEYFRLGETLWSNNGLYLFVANENKVEIHDMQSLPEIIATHQGNVTAMAINPLDTILATGTADGEVHLTVIPTAEHWIELEACEEECTITALEFDPTGARLMIHTEEEQTQHILIYALPETLYR
ncbi:MAG: WD40 repeat domain-containing protein, partial [Anaerolineae bacterium]|nr:WD40 repeat domain-containing protein [Anaerolineae bacterium]